MQLFELTLDDPAANLALDEALMLMRERAAGEDLLRLWQPRRDFVVVGRGSRVQEEVRRDVCDAEGIPILRRCSGGAAIVAGPGCLMYTLVLRTAHRAALASVDRIHEFVLEKMASALTSPDVEVARKGISDLAIVPENKKCSGNSLRLRRREDPRGVALYHGTLLFCFDIGRIAALLRTPPRQPDYRCSRSHQDFVANLPMAGREIRDRIVAGWQARPAKALLPAEQTRQLVADRYALDAWNLRH